MIVLTKEIPYKYGDTIKILPLFDIHLGNSLCDERALKRDLDAIDDMTYIIGGGDWLDSIIVKDAKRYRKSMDSTGGDDIVDEQIDRMCALVAPYKDRIIGLACGNHEDSIVSHCSTNPIKRLCASLNVPFLGFSALVRLRFSEEGNRGRTVIVRLHHGWGGGSRTQGADLTKFSKDVANWSADLFLYGHVHRRQDDRVPRLGLAGDKLVSRPKVMVICGTYLKTYTSDYNVSYSEAKGYPPTEIGAPTITITPDGTWVKIAVVS
jgi:hypothetical protein